MRKRRNLDRQVVAKFKSRNGEFALLARRGESWSIYSDVDGRITIVSMPRYEAKKEFRRLKKVK